MNSTDPQTLQELITVKQDPESEPFQPDAKVNLQCSLMFSNQADKSQCLGEQQCPSVHWFRAGLVQSTASRIYTTNSSGTKGTSCDYNLSESLDEGTYYCAVATCGKILFGRGTRVETSRFMAHFFRINEVASSLHQRKFKRKEKSCSYCNYFSQ